MSATPQPLRILRTPTTTVGQMLLATLIAVAVAVIALAAIARVEWPAYPSSNQLHALTTVGQVGCLAGLLGAGWLFRHGRRFWAQLAAVLFMAAFPVVTLGMPLGATKLYLFGISVDQQFRTEYLTRLTDSPALRDMTYIGLPPFYPPGWFWFGGRAAALTGTPAWEMFKPWAIISITVAVAVALVLWQRLIRFEFALLVTLATTAVTLAYSSPEPYAAIITVLLPPVLVLAWSGLRAGTRGAGTDSAGTRGAGWAALLGIGIFLGFAATFYTLLFAYTAFTVTLMAFGVASARAWQHIRPEPLHVGAEHRARAGQVDPVHGAPPPPLRAHLAATRRARWRAGSRAAADPLARLTVIAVVAAAIASITWGPFLLRAARDPISGTGSAQHYLPADGAVLSFPMLQFTLLGALCLLGTLWLVARAGGSVRAGALAFGVVGVYLWSLLSMLTTLARTTLLGFRLQPTLAVLLTAAGVFGFIEITRQVTDYSAHRGWRRGVAATATVLGFTGAVAFIQDIPDVLRPDITIAYTDTDGYGQRADRRPPGAERYYAEVDAAITAATGVPRDQTVLLTADYGFQAIYPYFGFQGLTSHYANPLAQFDARAAAIESWSELKTAEQFTAALDRLPWQPPTVFLLRHGAAAGSGGTYTLRLAEDVYPNQPNVRRYTVSLPAALFDSAEFEVREIGPFVLAIRTAQAAHR